MHAGDRLLRDMLPRRDRSRHRGRCLITVPFTVRCGRPARGFPERSAIVSPYDPGRPGVRNEEGQDHGDLRPPGPRRRRVRQRQGDGAEGLAQRPVLAPKTGKGLSRGLRSLGRRRVHRSRLDIVSVLRASK